MRWKIPLIAAGVLLAVSAAVGVLAGPGGTPDSRTAAGEPELTATGEPEPTSTVTLATPTVEPDGEGHGVPIDSPACDQLDCGTFTTPGGNELHLPKPAVDGMTHAAEHRDTDPPHGHPHDSDGTPEPGGPDGPDAD